MNWNQFGRSLVQYAVISTLLGVGVGLLLLLARVTAWYVPIAVEVVGIIVVLAWMEARLAA